jgi:5-formyltetrahydrofolate cyclo-ligase
VVSKSEARRRLRALRRALPAAARAVEAAATVAICTRLLAGRPFASYAALPDELDLTGLHAAAWQAGQAVLLPRVAGPGVLSWHAVADPAELAPGVHAIPEPRPERCPPVALPHGSLVLVPGVGFAADGRRLGQGGGFYDRLLAARPDLVAIGVGFACQLDETLPVEAHDRRLDGLVLGGRIVREPCST